MTQPVLDKEKHARILQDITEVCTIAGVQERFLHSSMTEFCGPDEQDWVKRFNHYRAEGVLGLLLHGISRPDTRCQAIAAALLRNFIDARVIPLNTVLEKQEAGEMPLPTVLLIPNLYTAATSKNLPAWKVQMVYDVLLQRSVQGKPSVLYVETTKNMADAYGKPFVDFIQGFREIVK